MRKLDGQTFFRIWYGQIQQPRLLAVLKHNHWFIQMHCKENGQLSGLHLGGGGPLPLLGELLPLLDFWKVNRPLMETTKILDAVHALVHIKSTKQDHSTSTLERSLSPKKCTRNDLGLLEFQKPPGENAPRCTCTCTHQKHTNKRIIVQAH